MVHWFTQSYWRDEAFSIMLAREGVFDIFRLSAGDFSPPFYHILLKTWVMLWGEGEVATRSLSVLCFAGTVFTLILISRDILHLRRWYHTAGVILLALLSPILTYYAFETRMYSLTAFLATLSFYFFLKKRWVGYLVVGALGLYTHYFMFFIIGIQFIYGLHTKKARVQNHARHSSALSFSVRYPLFAIVAFLLWIVLTLLMHQGGNVSGFWIPRPSWYELATLPAMLATGFERGLRYKYNLWPLTLVFWVVVVTPLLSRDTKHITRVVLLSLWAFMPAVLVWALSQVTTPLFLPRYLIVSAPAVILLVVLSLSRYKPIFQAGILALLAFMLWGYQSQQLSLRTKSDLRATIREASAKAGPADYLLVQSELDFHIAQVYWHDPKRVKIIGKTYDQIPQYVGKVLIPESALAQPNGLANLTGYVLSPNGHITEIARKF